MVVLHATGSQVVGRIFFYELNVELRMTLMIRDMLFSRDCRTRQLAALEITVSRKPINGDQITLFT